MERIGVEIKMKEIRRIEAGRKERDSRVIVRVYVMVMTETWVERKDWVRMRNKLSDGYD